MKKIQIEYYITLNCNLDCIACSSFSPLVKKKTPHIDFEYIKKDFKKLYKVTEDGKKISVLVLMGGEPLLHPNINQIIQYFSELGVSLRIVTNGILIPAMDDEFFKLVRKYSVEVIVSIYKVLKYEKVFRTLNSNNIPYRLYDQQGTFGHKYLHNEKRTYIMDCWYRHNVHILKDNKIYTCSETAFFNIFDAKFKGLHKLKITNDDYIDLDDVETFEELMKLRSTSVPPLCYNCDGSEKNKTEWVRSDGSMEEWLNIKST